MRDNVLHCDRVPTTGVRVTRQNIFIDLRKFSGFGKDSWIVNYFRFSWKLFMDLWIEPGFEIVFLTWKTFQKQFVLKISILNIFSDLQNIYGLSLFGFRRISGMQHYRNASQLQSLSLLQRSNSCKRCMQSCIPKYIYLLLYPSLQASFWMRSLRFSSALFK